MKIGWFGAGSGVLGDAAGVADVAVAAERLGYESIWIGEHPVLVDPHQPPSPLPPHSELLDPVPALAFAAARTSTIRIGSGIVILPLRNPVTFAKEMASIDVLSGGRLDVGIGVGYVPGEYEAIGYDFHTRGRRADECVDALRALWESDTPAFEGAHVSFSGIQCRPQPRQRPLPIHASGMSTAARRRAVARCHGWYGFFLDVDRTRDALDELARLHREVDRPAELGELEITITPPPVPVEPDTVRAYEALGVHRLVPMRAFEDMAGVPNDGTRAQVIDEITATAERLGLTPREQP
jgi:probable F420-dependent oxidoreductase